MIIGKCRGVTINFLRSDKDYGHNLSIPPMEIGLNPFVFWGRQFWKAVFLFQVFILSFTLQQNFTKHVDRWTKWENSKKTISSSFILSCQSLDFGQEAAFLFYVFFMSFKKLAKSVDWWTSSENYEKNIFNLMYILICKCGYVDKKVFFYFIFSFCYVLFTILTKKCGQVDQ